MAGVITINFKVRWNIYVEKLWYISAILIVFVTGDQEWHG